VSFNKGGMGLDLMKLQQLKAYQPPKLDYLNNMKNIGDSN
jgi:hypothetical protein